VFGSGIGFRFGVNEDCRDGVVTEQRRVSVDDEEWV